MVTLKFCSQSLEHSLSNNKKEQAKFTILGNTIPFFAILILSRLDNPVA